MSALINRRTGLVRQLDASAQPDEIVTVQDVTETGTLARILRRLLVDVQALKRRFVPRTVTFTDVVSTGTSGSPFRVTLVHGFGTLVHWETVRCIASGAVTLPFVNEVTNDGDRLVLDIFFVATLAVRIEERG